jgi:L-fucose isomerase-like protein
MNVFTQHPKPEIRLGILFLKRQRPGFVPEWGEYIEKMARRQLQTAAFDTFIPETKIVDVISLRAALKACDDRGCRVLVALQPTVSDGRMAPVLGQCAKAPVVFWATPEKQEGSLVSACSLVGAHTFTATLAQLGHPFDFVYGMPGETQTVKDLTDAVYRSCAYSVINGAGAGLVGYHAPGFINMNVDPASLRAGLNVELFHIGMNEFIDGVHAVGDAAARTDLAQLQKLGLKCAADITEADLLLDSKYYLRMKELMDSMPLQVLAVRDWPELSATHWPYLAMARLASEGYAIAPEGDVDGALSCLLGYASGCGACHVSDWLEHDDHHITLWHGGAAPFQLCEGPDSRNPPEIAVFFNNRKPVVVDATLKTGMPITLFRLWHLNGKYLFTAIEGETVAPKRHLKGTNGVGRFDAVSINDYFRRMIRSGFPHHVIIAQGHVKTHLYSLMANLKIQCID